MSSVKKVPDGQKPEERVLVAVDGHETAEYALHWYLEHLHQPSHYVIVLHAHDHHHCLAAGVNLDPTTIKMMVQEEQDKEKTFLEGMAAVLKQQKVSGKVKSVDGRPGEVIIAVAEEENALFIICGSRGHGKQAGIGSVSNYVLNHSHVPVFVCKHKDQPVGSVSLKEKLMNSPLFRRKNKGSPKASPRNSPQIERKTIDHLYIRGESFSRQYAALLQ